MAGNLEAVMEKCDKSNHIEMNFCRKKNSTVKMEKKLRHLFATFITKDNSVVIARAPTSQ